MQASFFYGRLIPTNQLEIDWINKNKHQFQRIPAIYKGRCQRCFTKIKATWSLPSGITYCGACIQLGRITSLDEFWTLPEPNDFLSLPPWKWSGQLTQQQQRVVEEILSHREDHLVWAVTGAGKTEMLFPVIAKAIAMKQRICLAAPRIDVILELVPRLKIAFPNVSLAVLYGDSKDPYRYTQLVICTTHQLLKFWRAFDVLIIDEVDAFPFANNKLLKNTPFTACKLAGRRLFLTATPTITMLLGVKHKSYLPRRFHGYYLPEITTEIVSNWRKNLFAGKLPLRLEEYIIENDNRVKPLRCLIFVPTIADIEPVVKALEDISRTKKISGVSAQDNGRIEKVEKIRKNELRYLVTTTILERGVTIGDIDVIILGADHANFSSRSLIQIAGRVGRKVTRPTGMVLAIMAQPSWQVIQAQLTIKWLNKQGRK